MVQYHSPFLHEAFPWVVSFHTPGGCDLKLFSEVYIYLGSQQTLALRPNLAYLLFLDCLWAKDGCYIFKWLKRAMKRKRIFCSMLKLYEIKIPMSIHKVLWEGNHAHWLTNCLCILLAIMADPSRGDMDSIAHKAEFAYPLALCGKHLIMADL